MEKNIHKVEFDLTYCYEEPPVHYEVTIQILSKKEKNAVSKVRKEVKQFIEHCKTYDIENDQLQYKKINFSSAKTSWLKSSNSSASESVIISEEDFYKLTLLISSFLSQKREKGVKAWLVDFLPVYYDDIDTTDHIPAIMSRAREKINHIKESLGITVGSPILVRETSISAREPNLSYNGYDLDVDLDLDLDLEFEEENDDGMALEEEKKEKKTGIDYATEDDPTIDLVKSSRHIKVKYEFIFPIISDFG